MGEVGQLAQQNMFGEIKVGPVSGGRTIGSLSAQHGRTWGFQVLDESGTEVARITKTWEGLAEAVFSTADNYVVTLQDPLLWLVVAAALTVDTALEQDSR